jgi:hypothetical protein
LTLDRNSMGMLTDVIMGLLRESVVIYQRATSVSDQIAWEPNLEFGYNYTRMGTDNRIIWNL